MNLNNSSPHFFFFLDNFLRSILDSNLASASSINMTPFAHKKLLHWSFPLHSWCISVPSSSTVSPIIDIFLFLDPDHVLSFFHQLGAELYKNKLIIIHKKITPFMRHKYNFDIVVSLPFFQSVLNFVYLGIGTAIVSFLRKSADSVYLFNPQFFISVCTLRHKSSY
jgi:hypothetical protein